MKYVQPMCHIGETQKLSVATGAFGYKHSTVLSGLDHLRIDEFEAFNRLCRCGVKDLDESARRQCHQRGAMSLVSPDQMECPSLFMRSRLQL